MLQYLRFYNRLMDMKFHVENLDGFNREIENADEFVLNPDKIESI